jgi:hypothetical protein
MSIVIGLLLICLAKLVAVGGLVLVQRLMPARRRLRHNDVAGFIYAVLGVAYAVLLGLVVVAVWKNGTRPPLQSTRKPARWPRSSGSPTGYPNPRAVAFRNSSIHRLSSW